MKNYYTEDEIEEGQRLLQLEHKALRVKYPHLDKKQDPVIFIDECNDFRDFIQSRFSKRVMFKELQGKVFNTVEEIEPHIFWIDRNYFCGELIKFSINKNEFYLLKISDGYSILDFYCIPDELLEKIEELIKTYK